LDSEEEPLGYSRLGVEGGRIGRVLATTKARLGLDIEKTVVGSEAPPLGLGVVDTLG